MTSRIPYKKHVAAIKPLRDLTDYVHDCRIETALLHLVFMRASQLNGCAFCVDMHAKEAIADGEDSLRLLALPTWRETDFFSEREQAALAWCEAVTRLTPDSDISDELYARVTTQFTDEELLDLNLAVITINSWNRMAKPFRSKPGSYTIANP